MYLSKSKLDAQVLPIEFTIEQSPTLGAHTHAHGFWVAMGAMLLFMGGHGCDIIVHGWAWVGIGFVHPCIQLQIGVKLLGCREYANQEALQAEATDSEWPLIVRSNQDLV
jgi:hypothetical protein